MTPILAGITDFGEAGGNPLYFFYEQLADVCTRCSDVMMVIAFAILFAGMVVQVYKGIFGGDFSGIMKQVLLTGLVISIMPFYAEWFLELQKVLGDDLLAALEVDPIGLLENFGTSFAEAPFDTGSAPDIILGIFDPLAWFEYFSRIIGAYVMAILGIIMYCFIYIGFQVQVIAIYLGCAAGPLFLAMLLFEPTRDSAVKYHVGMVGICFWPLGWGLGLLFGEAMLEGGTALLYYVCGFLLMGGVVEIVIGAIGIFIILVIVIAWFLVTLFGAPKVVQKAVTSGAQIGMSLVQGGMSTATTIATSAASTAIQMGSGAAMAAGGAALTIGTGGAGAMAGVGMMTSGASSMVGGATSALGGVGKAVSAASSAADKN